MKVAQEKIHVQELLGIYSLEHLQSYKQCPQVLAEQLKDLETISMLAHSQFAEIVVDLRKKSLEYDKTFKVCDKVAREILEEIRLRRSVSNNNFAYSIHSLSAQSVLSQFPQRRLLTELKLKFLESQGVDQGDWEKWFSPQEKVLLIRDKANQIQIKLGIRLVEGIPASMKWDIYDATSNSHHYPQLYFFLREYVHWMSESNTDWEEKLISRLRLLLQNLPSIYLFISMREDIRRRDGEIEKETLKLIERKSPNIAYMWKFDIFQHIESPTIAFFINQQKIYELTFKEGAYKGVIFMKHLDSTLILKHQSPIRLHNRYFLLDYSLKVQNYCNIVKKFEQKYQALKPFLIPFFIIDGEMWKPEELAIKQDAAFEEDGVFAQAIKETTGNIIKIDEDMSVKYPQLQRGFFNHLLSKFTSIPMLILHIKLRNEIIKNNRQLQFKIYRVSYLDKTSEVVYEFRSYRYIQQQRIFKEEQSMQIINQANDNFVLILKVSFDFTEVNFSAYKILYPQQQEKITDKFLPRHWREYKEKVKERYEWSKICECITYLCKCYLVERSYNRRMTEEQRKMTIYSFK